MSILYYLKKYMKMSRRQRKNELKSTLWFMPFWYIVGSICLSFFTYYLDYVIDISLYLPVGFGFSGTTLQVLLSALVGGVLTLSAFTINSLLVALTTFSGQFSSKMLVNFVSDRATQHVVGIFNGCFIYVLLNFLYVTHGEEEYIVATPILSILTAILAAITFIYFINHTTTWMQVHNISYNLNIKSKSIHSSLEKELQPFHSQAQVDDQKLPNKPGKTIYAKQSGYLQVADFAKLIKKAQEDHLLLQFEVRIGEFVLDGSPIFSYWSSQESVNPDRYLKSLEIGLKQTEIQDLEYGLSKLSEVAIKALGHNDPLTVTNTLHQITDLIKNIVTKSDFSPYLFDQEGELRLILMQKDFRYYLHKGFAYIREFSNQNSAIITEILSMVHLLSKTIDERYHEELWEFSNQTILGFKNCQLYENDCYYMLEQLYKIALETNRNKEYSSLQSYLQDRICADMPVPNPS